MGYYREVFYSKVFLPEVNCVIYSLTVASFKCLFPWIREVGWGARGGRIMESWNL